MPLMSCYLNLLDSTSAVGWLFKSSFHLVTQYKQTPLARKHTEVDMEHNLIGYSQHVWRIHNDILDCLSRDFYLSNNQLTFPFLSLFPEKMMNSIRFVDAPGEIIS
mmetsp:Transcript_10344/g.15396  ORF Transcript_10344/g.15396 Transcript_10344/m.15396 type:complete len:106 (+) Transcript_10344:4296-4613(+)